MQGLVSLFVGMENYLSIFCFLGGFVVFVRLFGLREAGGFVFWWVGFSSGNTNSLTCLTDLVPFPLDFSSGKRTLPLGKLTLPWLFLGKLQFSLHFGRISCHFPTFSEENLRYLGCCCCPEKTDVTLVVVVVVFTVVVLVIIVLVVVVSF